MRRVVGPAALVIALVCGITVGEAWGPGSARLALGLGIVLVLGAGLTRHRTRLTIGVVGLALLGAASMQRALDGLQHSALTQAVARYESATITVTLVDDPSGTRFAVDALARVEAVDRSVLLVARGDAATRVRLLEAGDHAVLVGSYRPLAGYDTRMRWRHAIGAFETTRLVSFGGPSGALLRVANALRGTVLAGTASLPATERALLAGLLLGDTRAIPQSTVDDFRSSGLTHHLAVSGENVAFVLALLAPLRRRLGLRAGFAVGIGALVVFGAMTRWEPSVLRAITMSGCVMLAALLGRPAEGVRVLALAAGALLLADPFLVHSIGFAMSCGATAGIALLSPWIAVRLPGPAALREPIALTAAAQIGVAPVVVPVFGGLPAATLPANLLAAPLMAPITVWGLATGVLGGLLGATPQLAALAQQPTAILVRALEGIAAAGARMSSAIDGGPVVAVLVGTAVGLGALAGGRGRRPRPDRSSPGVAEGTVSRRELRARPDRERERGGR